MPQTKCRLCGKEFYAKPNHLKRGWGKYCSAACSHLGARKGRFVLCDICGKKTWKSPKALRFSKSGKLFCGKSCQTIWRNQYFSGPKHPFWKDGTSVYRYRLIKRGAIPVCVRCGNNDKRVLVVHHKDKNRKNGTINNLVWLCHNCHYLVHRYKI